MATNAPNTRCWICGRPDEYRVVPHHREPWQPVVFGPTDWEQVPHDHTQAEIDAWLAQMFPKSYEYETPWC